MLPQFKLNNFQYQQPFLLKNDPRLPHMPSLQSIGSASNRQNPLIKPLSIKKISPDADQIKRQEQQGLVDNIYEGGQKQQPEREHVFNQS